MSNSTSATSKNWFLTSLFSWIRSRKLPGRPKPSLSPPQAQPSNPLNLTTEELESLQSLVLAEGWPVYWRVSEGQYQRVALSLLDQPDYASYQHIVGRLKMLEEMALVVEQLLAKWEDVKHDRTEHDARLTRSARDANANRFGSRLWGMDRTP